MGRIPRQAAAAAIVAANLFLATGFAATATAAVSLTNRDDREHKVTVIEGDAKVDHLVKPQQELKDICKKGCVVRLNDSDDDEYELEMNDIVSIEDGYLYYDEPPAGETKPGDGKGGDAKGEKK
jgi:deoxycytidylate deaminase